MTEVINIELPSGKKMNIGGFDLKTIAEFSSVYSFKMPYKKLPPKERKAAIKKDWDFIKKSIKPVKEPEKEADKTED